MYQRILVPIDGSFTSDRGLREAIDIARLTQGRLRLMHVIDELSAARARSAYSGYATDWLDEVRKNGTKLLENASAIAQSEGVDTDILLHDSFSTRLSDAVIHEATAWQADLIVVGTHGRRGVGRFLMGSGAESILRNADIPVLLVRATDPPAPAVKEKPVHVSLAAGALSIE